jgi:hypothetical protein
MAQSILKHPQAVMSELRQDYEIPDEDGVLAFPERHPGVAPLLPNIRREIRRYFGDDPVRLEMFTDPEWPEEVPELVGNIQTRFRSHEALERLHRFGQAWWLKQLEAMDAPIIVSFEHARRV